MKPEQTGRGWRGVVVGFDATDRGRCAVRWAAAQASRHGCPLYVVGVLETPPAMAFGWAAVLPFATDGQRSWTEQRLLVEVETCRDAFPGLNVHGTLHEGNSWCRLADYADQVGADLIAVGESVRGRLSRRLLGSTADELIRSTDRPVVVVRDPTPVQQASMLTGQSPVVAGVEDVRGSGPVLDFAFDAAAYDGSDLTVVVAGTPSSSGMSELGDHLERWRPRFPQVAVTIDTAAATGPSTWLERSEAARLLVVGQRARSSSRGLLNGLLSDPVPHDAACSVAVVTSGERERTGPVRTSGRPRAGR